MALITPERLKLFAPKCDANRIAPLLQAAAVKNDITTPRRIRHWLSQLHHESAGFTRLVENLNYRAERLMVVWPKRFPTLASAQPYAGNPTALAEKVYGGRLGNTHPGDGGRYLGRGWIMNTGLANYINASVWSGIGVVAKPELAAEPETASLIAGAFWRANGCNEAVDSDADEKAIADIRAHIRINEEDDLNQARRIVNGGVIGIDGVREALQRSASIWGA